MKQDEFATIARAMRKKVPIAVVALLAGALMLPDHAALAGGGGVGEVLGADAGGSRDAGYSSRRAGTKNWIRLHRPDGEVVHIKVDHIVFVMSAADTGADKRARSKVQLVNGFSDVRESVEEVMQAIQNDDSLAKYGS